MKRRKPVSNKLFTEVLEDRLLLHTEGVFVGADARFSLSFAPDGTEVATERSTLYAQMDALAPRDEWQSAIIRGFQTWAQLTNGDIALVEDDGTEFGSAGQLRGDERFGDIRIGSVPLEDEVYAISISSLHVTDGTWAGDVFFNSNLSYESLDDLFAISLHEAGHVFGLEHSDDPDSPMFPYGIPETLEPTIEDIATLHSIFGERVKDPYESNPYHQHVPAFRVGNSVRGTAPSIVFADIDTVEDRDSYRVHLASNYTGSLTFQLVTSGISQLEPRLTVRTPEGIASTVQGDMGSDVSITITAEERRNGRYNVYVDSAGTEELSTGSYSLVVWYNDVNQVPEAVVEKLIREPIRYVHMKDFRGYFARGYLEGADIFSNLDQGNNDIYGTELATVPGFVDGTRYTVQATIESDVDIDRYVVAAPFREIGSGRWGQVSIRGTSQSISDFNVNVYNSSDMSPLTSEVVVSSGATHVVQFEHDWDESYVIEVVGNGDITQYELNSVFGAAKVEHANFAGGRLQSLQSISRHKLVLKRPQLFHFNLESSGNAAEGTQVQMSIRTRGGRVVESMITEIGNTSTMSIFLRKGSYYVTIKAVGTSQIESSGLQFRLSGSTLDDPLGPRVQDPGEDPFTFDDKDSFFVPFIASSYSIHLKNP